MNNDWTFECAGQEKTCSAWGMSNVSLSKVNQDADTLSFTLNCRLYDADLPFAFGGVGILKYQGQRVFYGHVQPYDRVATTDTESVQITFAGPWQQLKEITYLQLRKVRAEDPDTAEDPDNVPAATTAYSGHLVLNQSLDGQPIDTAAQIADALTHAITQGGAPIAIGEMPENVVAPFAEMKCVTVDQVIVNMLRWTPDAVAWFDYTTTPFPTLHITRRAGVTATALPLHGRALVRGNRLRARYDLQLPCVAIIYEYGTRSNGTALLTDVYPPGANIFQPRAAVMTIDLYPGPGITHEHYHVDYEPINHESADWWKANCNGMANVEELTITEPFKPPGIIRRVTGGAFPPGYTHAIKDALITCKGAWKETNSKGAGTWHKDQPLEVRLNGTDEVQEDFDIPSGGGMAEQPPAGLAEKIFQSVAELQYEGQIDLNQVEAQPGQWHPGQLLNLTGGRAEWTTARAQIQQVDFDLDHGRTSITLGPTKMLSATDMVEILRAARQRSIGFYATVRTTGTGGANKIKDGGVTANSSGAKGDSFINKQIMVGGGSGNSPGWKITHDAEEGEIRLEKTDGSQIISLKLDDIGSAIAQNNGGTVTIKLREIDVCENGQTKKMLILGSAPYGGGA